MFDFIRRLWRSKKGAEERANAPVELPKEQRADLGLEQGCIVEIEHDMLQLLKSELNFHYSDLSSKIQTISRTKMGTADTMVRAYTDGDHYIQVAYTGNNEAANIEHIRLAEYQELTEEIPAGNKAVVDKWTGLLTADEYSLNDRTYTRAHPGVMEFTEFLEHTEGHKTPLSNQVAVFERVVSSDIYEYVVVAVETDQEGNETGSIAVAVDLPKKSLIIT